MFDQEQAKSNEDEARKLFSVPDFIGDMCKTLASRIRGAVAGVTFDEFHKNSARIIRGSVLGYDRATNKIKVRKRTHSMLFQVGLAISNPAIYFFLVKIGIRVKSSFCDLRRYSICRTS